MRAQKTNSQPIDGTNTGTKSIFYNKANASKTSGSNTSTELRVASAENSVSKGSKELDSVPEEKSSAVENSNVSYQMQASSAASVPDTEEEEEYYVEDSSGTSSDSDEESSDGSDFSLASSYDQEVADKHELENKLQEA